MPLRLLFPLNWTALAGLFLGGAIVFAAQHWAPLYLRVYDAVFPVATMAGELVSNADGAAEIHITGKKNRFCEFIGMEAYAVHGSNGMLRDLVLLRLHEKQPRAGNTKPVGAFDLGVWRVWPTDGAVAVQVYVKHDCSGRAVLMRIADVPL